MGIATTGGAFTLFPAAGLDGKFPPGGGGGGGGGPPIPGIGGGGGGGGGIVYLVCIEGRKMLARRGCKWGLRQAIY